MRKKIHTLFTLFVGGLLAAGVTACSDWLDVNPKTDVKAEDLFTTESGFESALAGIYLSATDMNRYGDNWTFGFIDKLAQLYDNIRQGVDRADIYAYNEDIDGFSSKSTLAAMWLNSYNLIANANNFLSWLDKNGESVIRDLEKRDMFRGEALAWRAFLHFDLLRGWGPIYSENPEAESIPYRLAADNTKMPLLPASQVVEKVLQDLEQARQLLEFERETSLSGNDRTFRLNYWAVVAMQARVYSYQGNKTRAFECAQDVVEHCGLTLAISNSGDPIYSSEVIFGLDVYQMDQNYNSKFSVGPEFNDQYYCSTKTLTTIYETQGDGINDMRGKDAAFFIYNNELVAMTRKYLTVVSKYIIPLIRLPEMYYIMCENAPLADANEYITEVMGYRGLDGYQTFNTEEERIDALDKEYQKEFYAEGKYFFFLKAHKRTTFLNCPLSEMSAQQYVFPLPDAEKEYGWTSEESGTEEEDTPGETDNE